MALIYVVEDDTDIREIEMFALKNSGHETEGFAAAAGFIEGLENKQPDLVLLDIMLPDEDGLSVLKKIRNMDKCNDLPVIMVTARSSEIDKVRGLDNGADDYIAKPFGVMELISRVNALLRRTVRKSDGTVVCGPIAMNSDRHMVTVDDEETDLTFKEFQLLEMLMSDRGTVVKRADIMSKIWGYDCEVESRTLDMHIKTLRQKLGSAGTRIKTIRNVGYMLE